MWRWTVLALTACSGMPAIDAGDLEDDASIDAPRVELGTGTSSFVAIPDTDAELELIAGAQGGWHVDLTARIWGIEIDGAFISYEGRLVGGPSPSTFETVIELNASRVVREGDHLLRAGDFLQLDIGGPDDIVGMELEFRVELSDPSGTTVDHTRRATIVDQR